MSIRHGSIKQLPISGAWVLSLSEKPGGDVVRTCHIHDPKASYAELVIAAQVVGGTLQGQYPTRVLLEEFLRTRFGRSSHDACEGPALELYWTPIDRDWVEVKACGHVFRGSRGGVEKGDAVRLAELGAGWAGWAQLSTAAAPAPVQAAPRDARLPADFNWAAYYGAPAVGLRRLGR